MVALSKIVSNLDATAYVGVTDIEGGSVYRGIYYSVDATNWTRVYYSYGDSTFHDLCYAQGKFWAIDDYGDQSKIEVGVLMSSTDGISWVSAAPSMNFNRCGVIDGVLWAGQGGAAGDPISWYVYNSINNTFTYKFDGANWYTTETPYTTPFGYIDGLLAPIEIYSYWGDGDSDEVLGYYYNGSTWQEFTISETHSEVVDISIGNDKIIFTCKIYDATTYTINTADITISSGVPTFGTFTQVANPTSDAIMGIAYIEDEEKFKLISADVMVSNSENGTYGLKIYDSTDGITWTVNNYDTGIEAYNADYDD